MVCAERSGFFSGALFSGSAGGWRRTVSSAGSSGSLCSGSGVSPASGGPAASGAAGVCSRFVQPPNSFMISSSVYSGVGSTGVGSICSCTGSRTGGFSFFMYAQGSNFRFSVRALTDRLIEQDRSGSRGIQG